MKLNKIIASFLLICFFMTSFSTLINYTCIEANSSSSARELKFSRTEREVSLGKTIKNNPTKKGISSKDVMTWTSSNPNVAIVDNNGMVTSVSRGDTVITVSVAGLSASYNLAVVPGKVAIYDSNDFSEVQGNVILGKNETKSFELQDEFRSLADSEVEWESSKEDVCTVDAYGNVTTLDNGTSTITASLKDNPKIKDTIKVGVDTPVEEIVVDDPELITYVGESEDIIYSVLPEDCTSSRLKFEVQNKEIATVSSKGSVKGKAEGYTKVIISSVTNPEIKSEVDVEVRSEREYRTVTTYDVGGTSVSSKSQISASDGSYRVDKGTSISTFNDYGSTAVFTNNNKDIVDFSFNERTLTMKGKKEGIATITVDYAGMQDTIKVTVGNYIDKSVLTNKKVSQSEDYDKFTSVQKVKPVIDPNNPEQSKDYVRNYPLEVGIQYAIEFDISPVTADDSDLKLELSNIKDFMIDDGMIVALNPNKTTDLIITSKTNTKLKEIIKLKSSIGNVVEIGFSKDYVGENKFDINNYKEYSFNPIFIMESGKVWDPVSNPEIIENEVYKALKKNVKITCEDEDVVKITSNKVKPIKGVNGTGILKIEYDKRKNSRGTEESYDIVNETNFEIVGKVIETIKKISFVEKSYNLATGESYCFNPKITMSEGTVYDPKEEGVVDSEEYQQLLADIGLISGEAKGDYVDATSLLNLTYLQNGNTNNMVNAVYEGKCKLKMVVHSDNSISAETTIEVRSPYAIKNIQEGLKVSKTINATRYVNTDSLKIVSSADGNGETGEIPRSTAVWAFEKYSNGYARIAYNGDENLYVEAKYLAEKKEATVKKEKTSSSSSTSASSSSSSGSSGSSGSSSGGSSNVELKEEKSINGERFCVASSSLNIRENGWASSKKVGSVPRGASVWAFTKYTNGWCYIDYNGTRGYVDSQYLGIAKPDTYITNGSNSTSSVKISSDNDKPSIKKDRPYRYVVKGAYAGDGMYYSSPSGNMKYLSKGTKVQLVDIINANIACISYNGKNYYFRRENLGTQPPAN